MPDTLSKAEYVLSVVGLDTVINGLRKVQEEEKKTIQGASGAGGAGGSGGSGGLAAALAGVGGSGGAGGAGGAASAILKMTQSMAAVGAAVAGVAVAFGLVAREIAIAIGEAEKFGKEILTIQHITGSTVSQATEFSNLFKVTGANGLHDILELTDKLKTAEGIGALSQLGIKLDTKASGLDTLAKVIEALRGVKDGVLKTQLEMRLFGLRGVEALQGILMMTDSQFNAVKRLSEYTDEAGLKAFNSFQVSVSLLGETILQGLVFPILSKVLPAFEWMIDRVTDFVNGLAKINKMTGGILGVALAFGAVAAGIIFAAAAMAAFAATSIGASIAVFTLDTATAIFDALVGNWGAIAAAAAIGGIVATIAGGGDWASKIGETIGKWFGNSHGSDPHAKALKDLHETVLEIKGQMIGGGDRGHRVQAEIEGDYALHRTMVAGMG